MKRIAALFAFVVIAVAGYSVANAQPSLVPNTACSTISESGCPTFIYDLNAVGSQASITNLPFSNLPNGGSCTATFYATSGTWGADVYTSTTQQFTAVTKVGPEISATSAPQVVNIPVASGSGITAVRVQNRAYTSGSPLIGLDCGYAGQVWAPSVEPTPTATP